MRVSEFAERKGGGDGRRLGTTQLKGVTPTPKVCQKKHSGRRGS